MRVRSENAHRFVSSHTAGNGKSVPVEGLITPPCRDRSLLSRSVNYQECYGASAFSTRDPLRRDRRRPDPHFLEPEI